MTKEELVAHPFYGKEYKAIQKAHNRILMRLRTFAIEMRFNTIDHARDNVKSFLTDIMEICRWQDSLNTALPSPVFDLFRPLFSDFHKDLTHLLKQIQDHLDIYDDQQN